ncbi:MAG: ATP-dependent RNA helicase [Alkaliphilus sp.]|nr:MAG: ATP-dependent RNA helicase [Alkaliphilus sp.]
MKDFKEFSELPIKENILRVIKELGYESPTPIQAQAMPRIYLGEDVIGQAQTGTGKTAAFSIPLIEMVETNENNVQILVLTPTRELAVQVADEIRKFCKYMPGVKSLAIYGGQPIDRQIKALKQGVKIVVGTPGRIIDHVRRRTLKLGAVKALVLDEADQMLDMGFLEDIETILNETPNTRQTLMFSATIPREIEIIAKKYMKQPQKVKVVHKELTVPQIEQYFFEVKPHRKIESLCRILDMEKAELGMIFSNTKRNVDELVEKLQSRGYSVEGIHGDMKQSQRDRVMKKFRDRTIDLLIATDVAARGIDVENVSLVVNYDVPENFEYYVHRIGRTGRAGNAGLAYTLVASRQIRTLKALEKYIKCKISRKEIPSINAIVEKQRDHISKEIFSVVEKGGLTEHINMIERMSEEYNSIEVGAAILKMYIEKNTSISAQTDEDLSVKTEDVDYDMVRIFISVGKNHGIQARHIVGAITAEANIRGKSVGSIELYDKFTFVEVSRKHSSKVIKALNGTRLKGRRVSAEIANKKAGSHKKLKTR